MKVKFEIANGYRADANTARENGDYESWVDAKFGSRIRDVISKDFTLDIQDGFFIAEFTYEDDGRAFLKTFGGRQND